MKRYTLEYNNFYKDNLILNLIGKSKSAELEEKVKTILEEDLRISKEAQRIKYDENCLESDRKNLNESVKYARNLMDKKVQLENNFLDYTFYHYGSEASKKIKSIEKFFINLSKYSGQLILENSAGCNFSGVFHKKYEEGSIFLGRLQPITYSIRMPERSVEAVTFNLKIFRKSDGWKNAETNLHLDNFINEFLKISEYKSNNTVKKIISLLQKGKYALLKNNRPEGIYIDIFSPIQRGLTFGPAISYDYEPHQSLIVGDKAVRHYLKKQKLEIIKKLVSLVEIPNI
ncbi:MAG: hypothetical protein ABIH79_01825 [archaeon]